MQVREWELLNSIEPVFAEDKIILSLAYIASVFANGVMKLKNGKQWKYSHFLIDYYKQPQKLSSKKPKVGNIKEGAENLLRFFGKSTKKQEVVEERIPYALEAVAKKRETRPKRLQRKGQK